MSAVFRETGQFRRLYLGFPVCSVPGDGTVQTAVTRLRCLQCSGRRDGSDGCISAPVSAVFRETGRFRRLYLGSRVCSVPGDGTVQTAVSPPPSLQCSGRRDGSNGCISGSLVCSVPGATGPGLCRGAGRASAARDALRPPG